MIHLGDFNMVLYEISIALWVIFFGLSIVFGVKMIRKARTPDYERPQKEYYLGMAIFIFVHLVARTFYFIYDFDYLYNGVLNETLWELGAIIGIAGIVFLLYAIERHIYTRSKFFFTILVIIYIILIPILPPEYETIAQTIVVALVGFFIPLIYIYVAYKSTSDIRKNSLLIAFGILIFLIGQTAHGKTFFPIDHFIYLIVSPILMIVGGLILLYGLIRPS